MLSGTKKNEEGRGGVHDQQEFMQRRGRPSERTCG
jgi:hypothetical protein